MLWNSIIRGLLLQMYSSLVWSVFDWWSQRRAMLKRMKRSRCNFGRTWVYVAKVAPRNHKIGPRSPIYCVLGTGSPREGTILGVDYLPTQCEVFGRSGVRLIFSTLFGRWHQRLGGGFSLQLLICRYCCTRGSVYSWVVSVLDSGAEGSGFKSQPRRCRVTVLGKLFTPIVPLFTKQRNW